MKTLNLFGLLIAGACTFQACHSPESRSKDSDSSSKDSSTASAGTGAGSSGTAGASGSGGGEASAASSSSGGSTPSGAGSTGTSMESESSKKDSMPKDVTNQSKVDDGEAAFMKDAAVGGMMEVELGRIAQKSANPQVKAFASQMVVDHSKANAELKTLASKSGIVLPTGYPADKKAHVDMMKTMTGTAFDKHYIDMMVTDHDKTIALFKAGADSQDKGIKDFAKKTLAVITDHYQKAKRIQAVLK